MAFTKTILLLSLGFLRSAFASESPDSHLDCGEFESIYQFIERQHLRFETMNTEEHSSLMSKALAETPDALRLLGFNMLAARFEQLEFSKPSQNGKPKSLTEVCHAMQNTIFRGAFLKAMARHLDPYSDFYLSEELDAKASALEGEFVGVGIGTEPDQDALKVNEVVVGGPADRKLFIGDRILKIDGHSVTGLLDLEIRQRIRGEKGSRVKFEGLRGAEPFQVSIVRDVVHQKSVSYSWLKDQVLQIKISRFFRQTADEVERLIRTEGLKARGFILDLRNNPGGLLQGARDVVNLFVPQGVVVYLKGRGMEDQVWALREGRELRKPVVVLVNSGTASAAEIVAGALQDYGRAVLVGQKTYGKGSVQNIYETQTALGTTYRGGLKLTTLWYYLPSGRSVKSLDPDVVIPAKDPEFPHPKMPYAGPDRIEIARHLTRFDLKRKQTASFEGKYHDSEEAGRAVLMKMLAGLPTQN